MYKEHVKIRKSKDPYASSNPINVTTISDTT